MRLARHPGTRLTYCTNIHPGETWPEVRTALRDHVPAVKTRLGRGGTFGVGLRLSGRAAHDLDDPAAFEELQAVLAENDLEVFTVNGFPFGAFHGVRVKEGVYAPDWRSAERLDYTNRLAALLARLLPEGGEGSISTVPGAFAPDAGTPDARAAIVEHLLRQAATLWRIEAETGRRVSLALEPEPACMLETTDQAVAFFREHLFGRDGVARLAGLTGLDLPTAEAALRRHLGVCFDVCHAAVEFEDVPVSLARLRDAGIRVPKVQLSAALRLDDVDAAALDRLLAFDEGVYLHQVVARAADGGLHRYLDIAHALEARAARARGEEWRVHFHVPVFLDTLDGFSSTQAELAAALDFLKNEPLAPHLEVETYTWDVLPARHRATSVDAAIARELQWTLERLGA